VIQSPGSSESWHQFGSGGYTTLMAFGGEQPTRFEGFAHPVLIYGSDDEFMEVALPFVEEGISRSEPTLVAVQEHNLENLRRALGGEPEGVSLPSLEQWYETSARTREKFASWAADRLGSGGRVRLMGEPPWATGNQAQVRDWARHESVLNVAFAGKPITFLCPYDARVLPAEIIEHAHSTHPTIAAGRGWTDSKGYEDPLDFCRRLDDRVVSPASDPEVELEFGLIELARLRRIVNGSARGAGLPKRKAEELALAVNEITTNAVVHGKPPATLRLWTRPDEVICEIGDSGPGIQDVLAGQFVPAPEDTGGRGLWVARLLCDAVEIGNQGESTVTLHMAAGVAVPAPA
jgi:anti-sigma regulatory factor (Ser/Thr protein kinase)